MTGAAVPVLAALATGPSEPASYWFMPRRRWTAAVALLGFVVGLWLSLVPYEASISIGTLAVSGRCPPALSAAFRRVPDNAFYDLGSGEGLPAELCARSARRRLAVGAAVSLFAGAVLVAGRTTWRRSADDE